MDPVVEPISDLELLDKYFLRKKERHYIELARFAELPFARLPEDCFKIFQDVERWVTTFLTQPHPMLGRKGAVCPFVKASVDKKSFYLTAVYESQLSAQDVAEVILEWKDLFLEIEPASGKDSLFRTLLLLFPEVSDGEADTLFTELVAMLKTSFVKDGLMLGEFHGGPPEKFGLHNKNFKPLYSPIPLLAIREMVRSDLPFLQGDPIHLREYEKRFSSH